MIITNINALVASSHCCHVLVMRPSNVVGSGSSTLFGWVCMWMILIVVVIVVTLVIIDTIRVR